MKNERKYIIIIVVISVTIMVNYYEVINVPLTRSLLGTGSKIYGESELTLWPIDVVLLGFVLFFSFQLPNTR